MYYVLFPNCSTPYKMFLKTEKTQAFSLWLHCKLWIHTRLLFFVVVVFFFLGGGRGLPFAFSFRLSLNHDRRRSTCLFLRFCQLSQVWHLRLCWSMANCVKPSLFNHVTVTIGNTEITMKLYSVQLLFNADMNRVSFNGALCPHKPSGLLGTGAQDGHLDFHTAPEL